MPDAPIVAWDYYLQGYRLHQRMTKEANFEACRMFGLANQYGGGFARALGHHSFSRQVALLNGWFDPVEAQQRLDEVVAEFETLDVDLEDPAWARIDEAVNELGDDIDISVSYPKIVIPYYAARAVMLDTQDYDNWWSKASSQIYLKQLELGLSLYQEAIEKAEQQVPPVPAVSVASLHVDRADALFFGASGDDAGEAQIETAIADTETAMKSVPADPKRSYWNWTLGWAYYELGFFGKGPACYARSLVLLQTFRNPTDLILKNIIADYVALDEISTAQGLAADFLTRNPGYDLSRESLWPYGDPLRLRSWKTHLSKAGLPGDPDA